MTAPRIYVLTAALLSSTILAALCILAPRMYPLQHEPSANFWYAATGIDIGATRKGPDIIVFDRDRFVYGYQWPFKSHQDLHYMTISDAEAARGLPRVVAELERRALLQDPDDWAADGYGRWLMMPNRDVSSLIQAIDAARRERTERRFIYRAITQSADFKRGLMHVSRAARMYWACFVFEAIFLPVTVWFVFWPFIRRCGTARKLLHIVTAPFLLFLPFWFGYCNTAGPNWGYGGILYWHVCAGGASFGSLIRTSRWEYEFLAKLPPFFSVITQGRTVTFADYFTSGVTVPPQPGPVNVTCLSAMLGGLYLLGAFAATKYRQHLLARPGFPVLNVQHKPPASKE